MPSLDSKCGLSSKELESILQILSTCAALKRAQLFGSRAMNTHRPTSDVDLALFGSDLLRSDINKLKIAFEDSLLPYTFDLIIHSEIKEPELLAHIERRGVDLYRKGFYLSDDGEWIPEGWKAFAISELLDFENKRRIPLSAAQRKDRKGQYPYYGASGIFDHLDDFIFDGEHLLISEDGENLISRKQPIAFKVSGKFWVNNHAHILSSSRPHRIYLLEKYISHLDISPFVTGAAQPKLSKGSLERIQFILPEKEMEQKAIADLLGSLDDKIELLREQNETLEALAQTLFKRWFIDFNFPDENGNPYKEAGGAMIASELGEIPAGWNDNTLTQCLDVMGGGTPKTSVSEYWDGEYFFFTPKDANNGFYCLATEKSVTKAGIDNSSTKLFPKNTIFVTARGTVGKTALALIPMAMNQSCYALKEKNGYNLTGFLLLREAIHKLQKYASGGVFDAITTSTLDSTAMAYPDGGIVQQFEKLISPIFDKIGENSEQVQTLNQFRDTILPKLMKGEIRVPVES